MQFRLLGPLEVIADNGSAVDIGPAKDRTLLAVLLLHVNETVSTARLVEELWGAVPPPSAVKLVQTYVSHLRKVLGDDLETRPPGYALRVDAACVDVWRFDAMVRRAGDEPPAAAARTLREALALWRGDAAQGLMFEAFAAQEVAQLEDARLDAVARRIDADLALGRHEEVSPELRSLLARHPYREGFAEQLMLALYRSSRQGDALAVYRETRRRLADDLGLEPGEGLRALESDILRQAPSIAAPATRAPLRPRWSRAGPLAAAAFAVAVVAVAAVVAAIVTRGTRADRLAPQSVGLIDPRTGRLVLQVHLGSSPRALAAAGGVVWAADFSGETVSRFAETGGNVVTIPVGGHPVAIAPTPRGAWVLEIEHRLVFVDGSIDHTDGIRPTQATQIAAGAGRIWTSTDGALVQARHLDGVPDGPPFLPRLGAAHLAATTRTLWTAAGQWVTPVDARTHTEIPGVRVPDPCAWLAARGGVVWCITDGPRRRRLIAIDAQRDVVVTTHELGVRPAGLAVGADGTAWVAVRDGVTSWTLGQLSHSITLGVELTAIAPGEHGIWVGS